MLGPGMDAEARASQARLTAIVVVIRRVVAMGMSVPVFGRIAIIMAVTMIIIVVTVGEIRRSERRMTLEFRRREKRWVVRDDMEGRRADQGERQHQRDRQTPALKERGCHPCSTYRPRRLTGT